MKITRIKIKKLFGYISKDVSFNTDISLLVGINGSGKTSILNLINWILSPSIHNLCITNFEKIELFFTSKETEYKIVCKHEKSDFYYELSSSDKTYPPLKVNILHNIKSNKISDDVYSFYDNLSPDDEELITWNIISSFTKPTIIGLDRNLYTETSNKIYLDESKIRGQKINKGSIIAKSPILKVKELINKEYRIKKNRILNLTNNLKNQMMLSAFDAGVTELNILDGSNHKIHSSQISVTKRRVKDYFNNFEKENFDEGQLDIIDKYFSNLENIIDKYEQNPSDNFIKIIYGLNANQFTKTIKLLKEFEKFERDSNNALKKISTFIETINHFFKDSNKQLIFKEDTSEICFHTVDYSGKILTKYNDIKHLSSGEEQILVLFAYIAFSEEKGKVFIIDEPELSLHIRWQESFINQLEKILDKDNQIILATHSPILANNKREKAILIKPV